MWHVPHVAMCRLNSFLADILFCDVTSYSTLQVIFGNLTQVYTLTLDVCLEIRRILKSRTRFFSSSLSAVQYLHTIQCQCTRPEFLSVSCRFLFVLELRGGAENIALSIVSSIYHRACTDIFLLLKKWISSSSSSSRSSPHSLFLESKRYNCEKNTWMFFYISNALFCVKIIAAGLQRSRRVLRRSSKVRIEGFFQHPHLFHAINVFGFVKFKRAFTKIEWSFIPVFPPKRMLYAKKHIYFTPQIFYFSFLC